MNPLKCFECECMHQREREREHWKEGQGTECVESKSIQWLWDQITFVAHTLSKSAPCLLLNIIIYWLLGTPTSRKFTINEMQKWKFKILSDLEKTEIPIYYTEAKIHRKITEGIEILQNLRELPKIAFILIYFIKTFLGRKLNME